LDIYCTFLKSQETGEVRYGAWGSDRYIWGTTPTTYRFTGQRFEASFGLYFYNARWLDPLLGRFAQADTVTPGGVQGLDRYAYTLNNPLKYTDPSGHDVCDEEGNCYGRYGIYQPIQTGLPPPVIPSPAYYQCANSGYNLCVTSNDDPVIQITHTIFGEGGALSDQAAANIFQTILNRAFIYWTQHHAGINPDNIPWGQISKEQLAKLVLFILSEPYNGSDGNQYPAYNAWGVALTHRGEFWPSIRTAVGYILFRPGLPPHRAHLSINGVEPEPTIRNNVNVIYYGASTDRNWRPSVPWVAVDELPPGSPQLWQYYGIFPIDP
jgi:RHS repeat-associated protein